MNKLIWNLYLIVYLIHTELKYDVFNFNGAKESTVESGSIEAGWESLWPDEQEEVRHA